jgi:hypothetical protein
MSSFLEKKLRGKGTREKTTNNQDILSFFVTEKRKNENIVPFCIFFL